MLGFEEGVAEDVGGAGHGYVVVCWKGFPDFIEEGAVVDTEGWSDALAEAGPVLEGVHVSGRSGVVVWEG